MVEHSALQKLGLSHLESMDDFLSRSRVSESYNRRAAAAGAVNKPQNR
jgi:hypothetical protein